MKIAQIVYIDMLYRLKLLYNMESLITTLTMATGHGIHWKSPAHSNHPSCHHVLVGVFSRWSCCPAWMWPVFHGPQEPDFTHQL